MAVRAVRRRRVKRTPYQQGQRRGAFALVGLAVLAFWLLRLRGQGNLSGFGGYGLTQEQASGYLLGWLDYAIPKATDATRKQGLQTFRDGTAQGRWLHLTVEQQLKSVLYAIAWAAPSAMPRVVRDIKAVGTPAEVALVASYSASPDVAAAAAGAGGLPARRWWIVPVAVVGGVMLLGLVYVGVRRSRRSRPALPPPGA